MVAPRQWPAARVEMRRVEDLRPYPRNARRHSPQHVDQIAASIQQWGWTIPLLVDESGELIAGHWFGRSQFQPITREHYEALREHALGIAFVEPYDEVVARFGASIEGGRADRLSRRSYFDNTHDSLSDVWTFPRVEAAERFEHATPKPVALVARALRTSCPDKGLVFEPFLGSGSTLIAAEVTGRRCFGAELQPRYAATTIRRWERHTGHKAVRL